MIEYKLTYEEAMEYKQLKERNTVLEPEHIPELANTDCTAEHKCRKCDADVYTVMNFCYHCGQRIKKEITPIWKKPSKS